MNGYIKLHRRTLDTGWLRDQKLWAVWCYCLLRATHRECRQMVGQQALLLQPGEFVFGRQAAARDLAMKESTLYKVVKRLEKLGNIRIKSNNKFSVITVVNWALYQGQPHDEEQQRNNKGTQTRSKEQKKENKDLLVGC
jgi:hypothetical protein